MRKCFSRLNQLTNVPSPTGSLEISREYAPVSKEKHTYILTTTLCDQDKSPYHTHHTISLENVLVECGGLISKISKLCRAAQVKLRSEEYMQFKVTGEPSFMAEESLVNKYINSPFFHFKWSLFNPVPFSHLKQILHFYLTSPRNFQHGLSHQANRFLGGPLDPNTGKVYMILNELEIQHNRIEVPLSGVKTLG